MKLRYRAALLYRRVAGQWQFQQVLRSNVREYDGYNFPSLFAMKGNLAAVELDGNTQAYRLDANGWQPAGAAGASSPKTSKSTASASCISTGDCDYGAADVSSPMDRGGWTPSAVSRDSIEAATTNSGAGRWTSTATA